MMERVTLPSGEDVPTLGQDTWAMAEDRNRRADEIAALRIGIDPPVTVDGSLLGERAG